MFPVRPYDGSAPTAQLIMVDAAKQPSRAFLAGLPEPPLRPKSPPELRRSGGVLSNEEETQVI